VITDRDYCVTVPAGTTTHWVKLTVANGTYGVYNAPITGTGPAVTAFVSGLCGALGTGTNCPQGATTPVTTTTGSIFLRMLRGPFAVAGEYTFRIDSP